MTVKFGSPESADAEEQPTEAESSCEESEGNGPKIHGAASPLVHSHDPEGRYNHAHQDGDRPHTGHAEDGSPIFELLESEPEDEGGCPKAPHLHATMNRRIGMTFPMLDIGHMLVTGKGPWSLYSHCPRCGKVVEDRGGRHFRCDGDGCDERWDLPRDQVKAAREAALHAPEGDEFVMLL